MTKENCSKNGNEICAILLSFNYINRGIIRSAIKDGHADDEL